jgi:hypothetical protein
MWEKKDAPGLLIRVLVYMLGFLFFILIKRVDDKVPVTRVSLEN